MESKRTAEARARVKAEFDYWRGIMLAEPGTNQTTDVITAAILAAATLRELDDDQ